MQVTAGTRVQATPKLSNEERISALEEEIKDLKWKFSHEQYMRRALESMTGVKVINTACGCHSEQDL